MAMLARELKAVHSRFFRRYPVFTNDEFLTHCARRNTGCTARSHSLALAYRKRTGKLRHLRRGIYEVVQKGEPAGANPADHIGMAMRLAPDVTLSHHTAVEMLGEAHSSWNLLVYSAARPVPPFVAGGQLFRGAAYPKALRDKGLTQMGVIEVPHWGAAIRVTGIERSLVDCLRVPALGGSLEEIWQSFGHVRSMDALTVLEYIEALGEPPMAAKVGFFLSEHAGSIRYDTGALDALRDLSPAKPHRLVMDCKPSETEILVKDWNLVVPREAKERPWDVVH